MCAGYSWVFSVLFNTLYENPNLQELQLLFYVKKSYQDDFRYGHVDISTIMYEVRTNSNMVPLSSIGACLKVSVNIHHTLILCFLLIYMTIHCFLHNLNVADRSYLTFCLDIRFSQFGCILFMYIFRFYLILLLRMLFASSIEVLFWARRH